MHKDWTHSLLDKEQGKDVCSISSKHFPVNNGQIKQENIYIHIYIQIGKEEFKPPLFTEDTFIYTKNPKEFPKGFEE